MVALTFISVRMTQTEGGGRRKTILLTPITTLYSAFYYFRVTNSVKVWRYTEKSLLYWSLPCPEFPLHFHHAFFLLNFHLDFLPFFQLLDLGIVYKENFDAEEDSKFHLDTFASEKRDNAALKEKREREEKGKEDSSKAFDEWLQLKSMRDQALRCLGLLVPPVLTVSARDMGLVSGGSSVAWGASSSRRKDEGLQLVIDVSYCATICVFLHFWPDIPIFLNS